MIWIIIPTYNEERALPQTLASVFLQSEPSFRIIVVDGGSTDSTRQILQQDSRITWLITPKGRASQMNAGAQQAIQQATDDDWLLFLHADTQLPPTAIQQLTQLSANPAIQAGGFRHRFSGTDWRLRMISWLDNFRCSRSHIVYGDQAIFVRQKLFRRVEGFPDQPVLEDVAFGEKLLTHTVPHLLPLTAVTDARKFIKMGVARSFIRVLMIILHVEFGLPTFSSAFFQDIR